MKTTIVTFLAISLLLTSPLFAQNCRVAFTSHKNGDVITDYPVTIEGTAEIPPHGHLWLLVQRVGFSGWYPQCNGELEVSDHKWTGVVYLGRPDNGTYRIAAVFVNKVGNESLNDWVNKTQHGTPYYTIPFPNALPGCSTVTLTVQKQ